MADIDVSSMRSNTGRWVGAFDQFDFREQTQDPQSYVSGALQIPALMANMKSAVAGGDMTAAKGYYDRISGFYADHVAETARWAAVDPSRNPALQSVQQAAMIGLQRQYDVVPLATPRGQMTASQLFGPDGSYETMRSQEIRQLAGFSQEVSDAVARKDDTSRLLGRVVDPIVRKTWETGDTVPGSSQFTGLAHHIATHADDVADLGFDTMNAVVGSILDNHMKDGTAVARYNMVVPALRARKAASDGVGFDGVAEARKFLNSMGSLGREVAGSPDGSLTGAASRGLVSILTPLVAQNPGIDLDDPMVRGAVGDVSGMLAGAQRAGVQVLPVAANLGVPVEKALLSYVTSRAQGVEPPEGNFFSRLAAADGQLRQILTEGWEPVRLKSRGNPAEAAGTAAGALGASSGLSSLDAATMSLYAPVLKHVMRQLAKKGMDAPTALREALTGEESRADRVNALARGMMIPEELAGVVADAYAKFAVTGDGLFRRVGLDRVVGELAFDAVPLDPKALAAQPALRKWYALSVGEQGAAYDRILDDWDAVLEDPDVGLIANQYKDAVSRRAAIEAAKMRVKRDMNEAAEKGLSPMSVAIKAKNQGRFYAVAGFIDEKGAYHTADQLDSVVTGAKDGAARSGRLARLTPVIGQFMGDLNDASQLYEGWVLPGSRLVVPSYPAGLWSSGPKGRALFKAHQRTLRDLYQKQVSTVPKKADEAGGIHVPAM